MVAFTYNVYDPLEYEFVAQLDVKAPSWVEVVNDNGVFSGQVVVPDDVDSITQIRAATAPGMMLYVRTDRGLIPFSGYITGRKWNSATNTISFQAVEWREYLSRLIVAPSIDLLNFNLYQYTQQDQLYIARSIVTAAIYDGVLNGVPYFQVGNDVSGVLRDLFVSGPKFRTAAAWIDSMANRDNGFEWDVYVKIVSNVPNLFFRTWYPQRGNAVEGLEFFYGDNGNILNYEDPEETNDQQVGRQWAVGAGPDSEAVVAAADDDPDLSTNTILRFDKVTQWQDVIDIETLSSHARAEREFYSVPLTLFTFTTTLDAPDVYSYQQGDRCRLVIKDRWLDIDQDNVRIIQRVLNPDEGGGTVKITVDLSDLTLPDTGDGGV